MSTAAGLTTTLRTSRVAVTSEVLGSHPADTTALIRSVADTSGRRFRDSARDVIEVGATLARPDFLRVQIC
jgi:hypothetical protein